ncbi:hypothetical protein GGI20_002242 [Coemansia sp. BCRC 34301]|nr:hypothetical protein GGI20_002242 [Coemansia sp. BCRC 34301]
MHPNGQALTPGLDFMAQAGRAAAATKQQQLQLVRPYLLEQHAVDIPDFTLSISAGFHTVHSISASSQEPYQSLSMGTRPRIVGLIRDRIVYLGQTRRRFPGLVSRLGASEEGEGEDIRFSDGGLDAAAAAGHQQQTGWTDSLDVIMISGPRHIGKSHVMLQVAALFASEPSGAAAVLYVGSCSALLLDTSDDDRAKYLAFVEYVVCALIAYPEIARLADAWYAATGMGTELGPMSLATSRFMRGVGEVFGRHKATLLLFLDEYEKLTDPIHAIINVQSLIHRLGVIVVASTSTPVEPVDSHHKCMMAASMTRPEAMSAFVATHGHLEISDDGLARVFEAAEYHPLDIVRTLAYYADKQSNNGAEAVILRSAISDMQLTRDLRITQMHLEFVRRALGQGQEGGEREGPSNELVSVDGSPGLLRIKREIRRAAFAAYHGLDAKHCVARDLQFADPSSAHSVRCFPPSSASAVYQAHFAGQSAAEQFAWALHGSIMGAEPPVMLRFFDALLLESGRIRCTARSAGRAASHVDLRFTHLPSFESLRGQRVEPRACPTLADAASAVAEYAAVLRARDPAFQPMAAAPVVRSAGAMLCFPRLCFAEPRMPGDVRGASRDGSLMACVVRVDRLAAAAGEWAGCEIEVTWIAADPLSATPLARRHAKGAGAAGAGGGELLLAQPKDVAAPAEVGGCWALRALKIMPDLQAMVPAGIVSLGMLAITTGERHSELLQSDAWRALEAPPPPAAFQCAISTSSLAPRIHSHFP